MTESRPPAGPRRAEPRSAEQTGENPFARPLPPGMGRPLGTPPAATRRSQPPAVPPAPVVPPTPAPARRRAAEASTPAGRPARRPPARESDIPLLAPPAWQLAGVHAERTVTSAPAVKPRGLPGWLALIVLLAIAGVGGLIDSLGGANIKGAFAIGLIVGALVAILLVRHTAMFPIVVAPPLVYFVASVVLLYVRSGGLSNRKVLTDAAANWLVYGFPAIAGATAVVLIVAGVRMILRR